MTIHLLSLDGKGLSLECMKVVILCTNTYTFLKLGVFFFDIVIKEDTKFIATLTKSLLFFKNCCEQTHPWVVPLKTSHLDFTRPIKFEENQTKYLFYFFHNFFNEYTY
jgi:hypothetical protein